MAKVPARLFGMFMLAASCGSTMIHKWSYDITRSEPAQIAEFALAFLTFVLAATGVLLLIHGVALFDRVRESKRDETEHDTFSPWSVTRSGSSFDTRHAAALAQARLVIARSARQRRGPATRLPLVTRR
ncbi:hypothetical protein [Sphingomonas guangdongensis]|uniref:hypothetical protein n=1 Tax=Sphingomonas guangdongensis TaxID=1141890 RepID=UPI0015CA2CBC|nr:hypothetical protein [Sphingomonas guangdongensis]